MTRSRQAQHGLITATINDVAARAGVSKRTVSRVMNGQPYITAETRDRVLSAMERLGYRPNPAARRLASGKSHLVGLFHSPCSPPDSALVEQVTLELAAQGYRVLVCSADCRSPLAAEENASLARMVPIDAAILCAPLSEQLAFGASFHAQNIPCVRLGISGRHGVSVDDREAARRMTRYLASLGHTRIAFVNGPKEFDGAQQRWLGFQDGLQFAGLAPDPALIVQGGETFDSGVECGRRLLRDGARRPTAIFACTDAVAAGVLSAAHEMGIPVPGSLSVAGFGDLPIASQVWPSLTSVRLPARELATRAALLLLELLNGDGASADPLPILTADIVIRKSTGAPDRRA